MSSPGTARARYNYDARFERATTIHMSEAPSLRRGLALSKGGRMVTRDEMLRIAMRHDTLMAHAMLAALGFPRERPRGSRRGRGNAHAAADRARYRAMRWCFRNFGSPCR